jgi:hypothetical protein
LDSYQCFDFNESVQTVGAANNNFLKEALSSYRIIIVRGIFTNIYSAVSRTLNSLHIPLDPLRLSCFSDQMEYFRENEIDYKDLEFTPEATPDRAGEMLVKEIKRSPKKVILLTHSKGGVDALHGLINHPEVFYADG